MSGLGSTPPPAQMGRSFRRGLAADVGLSGAAAAAAVTALAAALAPALGDPALPLRTLALALAGCAAVLVLAMRRHGAAPFGWANRITVARGALVMLVLALLGAPRTHETAGAGILIALAALALDGLDGAIARRSRSTSAFGARFDMETDAILIVVLCALAWLLDKAGSWVLLGGALRYIFVAAGKAWPWLAAPLPKSRRRQTVCVVQIATLIVCLIPAIEHPASALVALLGLGLLVWSFLRDVRFLAGERWTALHRWLALAGALALVNAAATMQNIWPTLAVTTFYELSVEAAALVLVFAAASAVLGPLRRTGTGVLALAILVLAVARYADVTAPAIYGRPVILFFDAQYLPEVAAMLAQVAPWWLLAACALGAGGVIWLLFAVSYWAARHIVRALGQPAPRRAIAAGATGIVVLYAAAWVYEWPILWRFAAPVTPTIVAQGRFALRALDGSASRELPETALPQSDFGAVAGADVLLLFIESYGAVAYDDLEIAGAIAPQQAQLAAAANATGRRVVSAYVESPTFGGGSWLAHAALLTGIDVRDQGVYELLLTQRRDTLPKRFAAAGYRTVMWMPGLRNAWPEGSFFGFDTIVGAQAVGYTGPDFGWWRVPDQFVLAQLDARERRPGVRAPLFGFVAMINSHIPFRPTPPYQPDWKRLLGPEPYDAAAVVASNEETPEWLNLGESYGATLAYTFEYLAGYLRERPADDFVLIVIGDHQPQANVTGPDARWDVPVHVVTSRPGVTNALTAAGFTEGMALERDPTRRSEGDDNRERNSSSERGRARDRDDGYGDDDDPRTMAARTMGALTSVFLEAFASATDTAARAERPAPAATIDAPTDASVATAER